MLDHVRSDSRADRSGALHRQPLIRQAGSRHRRCGSRGRRRCNAGERPGECARSAGRQRHQSRDRARNAAGSRARIAGGCSRSSLRLSPTGASQMPANRSSRSRPGNPTPELSLVENPDILATIAKRKAQRPKLVIGFAAETENVAANAKAKLASKGCDWILANDVSPQSGVMGGDRNTITLVRASGVEAWPPQSKDEVASRLVARIADALEIDAAMPSYAQVLAAPKFLDCGHGWSGAILTAIEEYRGAMATKVSDSRKIRSEAATEVQVTAPGARQRFAAAVLSERPCRRPRSAGCGADCRATHDCARRPRARPDRHRDRASRKP